MSSGVWKIVVVEERTYTVDFGESVDKKDVVDMFKTGDFVTAKSDNPLNVLAVKNIVKEQS